MKIHESKGTFQSCPGSISKEEDTFILRFGVPRITHVRTSAHSTHLLHTLTWKDLGKGKDNNPWMGREGR